MRAPAQTPLASAVPLDAARARGLFRWNLTLAVLHFVQFVAILALSYAKNPPVTSSVNEQLPPIRAGDTIVGGKLIPAGPELRAGLVRRVADKYGLPADRVPRIRSALGAEDPAVEAAYLHQFGRPIADAFTGVRSIRDRLRWTLARASEQLETLPPFWMAFALTLTETIAEGILAIPITVAGIGVIPGLVLLVALGLINVVTVAALVESITRTGRTRYGEAYLGRLVSEYLGRSGSLLFGLALFVGRVVVVLAYALGFASLLADATGIAPAVWVALLFAVNIAVLWRGTLDATVATALVIGAVNVVLILAICAIGLSHFELDQLLATDHAAPGGDLLALAFGVILLAYFGFKQEGKDRDRTPGTKR